jgi:hypothetical protein
MEHNFLIPSVFIIDHKKQNNMATYSTSPLYNYINVTIVINAVSSRMYFPDTPQLRPPAKIQAISYYGANTGMNKDYNNVFLPVIADVENAFLTLYTSNEEGLQNIPLIKLVNVTGTSNAGNIDGLYAIDNLSFDLSKSYVTFASGYSNATATPFSFMFGFYYL